MSWMTPPLCLHLASKLGGEQLFRASNQDLSTAFLYGSLSFQRLQNSSRGKKAQVSKRSQVFVLNVNFQSCRNGVPGSGCEASQGTGEPLLGGVGHQVHMSFRVQSDVAESCPKSVFSEPRVRFGKTLNDVMLPDEDLALETRPSCAEVADRFGQKCGYTEHVSRNEPP